MPAADDTTPGIRQPAPNTTTARDVVANPASFADRPGLFAVAWEILLCDRGRVFHPETVGPARHAIQLGEPTFLARAQARAASIGRARPAPLICPGART